MKPELQSFKIAEVCGWRHLPGYQGAWGTADGKRCYVLSAYCESLDAMHEAEKVLTIVQAASYWHLLHDLSDADDNTGHWLDLKATGHATAALRAEAFLKTLGLWEE